MAGDAQPDLRAVIAGELVAAGLRGALERKLPPLLERGESVVFAGMCTPAGSWRKEVRDAHALVATDRRLLLASVKFLAAETAADEIRHPQPWSIDFRDIRGFRAELGWFESKLEIEQDDRTVRLTSMRRKGARTVEETVRRHAPLAA